MNPESGLSKDWFDWAESSVADWKLRDAERRKGFSAGAEQVLQLASQAALSLNHDVIGAEHLLAGILKFNSGATAAALKQAGLSLPGLREEIESAWGESNPEKVRRPASYTPRCKGIIQRAQAKARLEGVQVEVENLLLQLLAERDGLPAQLFRKRAIDALVIKNALLSRASK